MIVNQCLIEDMVQKKIYNEMISGKINGRKTCAKTY